MDEATRKAVDRIEKLMRLAGNNPNPQEAASALARAQELLAAYNLDMTTVEAASGQSSKRMEETLSGGGYAYQRRLWRHIAELNFCMYFTIKVRVKPGSYAEKRHRTHTAEHRIIGRVVNVQQTKNMASYLQQVIERLRRQRFPSDTRSSDVFAYREGVADAVIEKIIKRRRRAEEEERSKAAEDARRAERAGTSMSTALTLASLKQKESDANYDFIHGEGASARRRQRQAEYEQEWAEKQRLAEEEWTKWCQQNPEEAKKMAEEDAKKERAKEKRRARSGGGYGRYRFRETKEDMRRSSGSYQHGFDDGETVSIDPQAESRADRRISHG